MSKTKFNTKKGVWLYRLACVGAMMIMLWSFILPFISNTASGAVGGDYRGGSDVDTTRQALWILEHPWEYTKILLKFICVLHNLLQCAILLREISPEVAYGKE